MAAENCEERRWQRLHEPTGGSSRAYPARAIRGRVRRRHAGNPRDCSSPGSSRKTTYSGGNDAARSTASPATAGSPQGPGAPDARREQARREMPRTRDESEVGRGSTASARAAGGPPGRDPRRRTARQGSVTGLHVDPPCAGTVRRPQSGSAGWERMADGGSRRRQLPDDRGAPFYEKIGGRR